MKRFTLSVDVYNSVTERNETNNVYNLEFKMCWPADLWPGPSMFLLHNDGKSSLEMKFGTETCITPDYLQTGQAGVDERNAYFSFFYTEINQFLAERFVEQRCCAQYAVLNK
eukprot:1187447-Prorocentrum_minimum.AAC.2